MTSSQALTIPEPNIDWRNSIRSSAIVVALVCVSLVAWATVARIDAAVVSNGKFSVESNRKTIQYLEGGIVEEILVRDGDFVKEGQVLLRMDATRFRATEVAARKTLARILAVEARLTAQRDMADQVVFPPEIGRLVDDQEIQHEIGDNRRQFESRKEVLARALDVLQSQSRQVQQDMVQAELDRKSAADQLETVVREYSSVKGLLAKGLVTIGRITALERAKLQFEGAIAKADNDLTKGHEKVDEIELRIAGLKQDYRQEAANALVDVGKQIAEFRQQRQISSDILTHSEIKAPVDGTVQQMRVFTIGGVIRPGDPILDIVPQTEEFVVRARVMPDDIDRVQVGMEAEIRPSSLMKFQREIVRGTIRYVSRDIIPEQNPNIPSAYAIEATVKKDTVPEDIRDKLVAGMDATVIIPTRSRSVLQYFLSPLLDNLSASLRER